MMNGKFGIELECFGVSRTIVVHAFQAAGLAVMNASYCGRDYDVWQIKTDGSIQGVDGFEVVSPVLNGEAGIAEARKACEILVNLNAQVNKSCGFHIHHNAANWNIAQFKNLFKRFAKYENAMDSIQPTSRRINRFCKSNVLSMGISKTFAKIEACGSVAELSRFYGDDRYFKLNLQSFFRMGSVEFRNHAGTVDANKVENYIRLTYGFVQAAINCKPVTKPTADNSSATLMALLKYMVASKAITPAMASFYQARQAKFAEVA